MRISDWCSDCYSADLVLQFGLGGRKLVEELRLFAFEIEAFEHDAHGLGADPGREGILAIFVLRFEQFVLGEELELLRSEERRAGKECVRTCRFWWWQSH